MTRSLGLDIGDARIGLALSDPLGILASPLKIITRKNSPEDFIEISDIARKNDISRIIVGLPVNMDGTIGSQAEKVRDFVKELSRYIDIPVQFKDERLTTVEAKNFLQASRKITRDTRYDAAAAALILQSYLDDSLPPQEIPDEKGGEGDK